MSDIYNLVFYSNMNLYIVATASGIFETSTSQVKGDTITCNSRHKGKRGVQCIRLKCCTYYTCVDDVVSIVQRFSFCQ